MLEEVVTAYEDYGINSILEASKMRFHESQESKQAGSPDWWRVSFQFIDLIFLTQGRSTAESFKKKLPHIRGNKAKPYNIRLIMENRAKTKDIAGKLAKLVPKHRTLTETAAPNPLDLNSALQFFAYHIHHCRFKSKFCLAINYVYILNILIIT